MRPGWEGQASSTEFGSLGKGSQHSSWEMWAYWARSESASATEQGLRGAFQAVGGESCLGEDVTFDIGGQVHIVQAFTGWQLVRVVDALYLELVIETL